jgi:transposase
MKKERKHYTAEEKVAVLRRHLLDRVPVSDLCEELLQPTVFYRWQKELFENGSAAFQSTERPHRQVQEKQKRIEFLEKKVIQQGNQPRPWDPLPARYTSRNENR